MTQTPQIYLEFDGRCEAALRFYEQHLGGRVVGLFTWGGSPIAGNAPPEWADKVMHATLALGNSVMAAADVAPGNYHRPQGFSVLLPVAGIADTERVFHALAENGTVTVPLQETFWAVRFGAVIDQFGIPWSINCEAVAEPAG